MNFVSKSGAGLAAYLKTSSQVVSNGLKPLAAAGIVEKPQAVLMPQVAPLSGDAALRPSLPLGRVRITSGPAVSTQVRLAHTDIRTPDFSDYRRESVKNPRVRSEESEASRKAFTYMLVGASSLATAYAAKSVVTQFVMTMSASADVLALAKIEIKLSDIPEGKSVTFKWRGKPLFIRHRTAEEVAIEEAVPVASLRDPQKDSERVQKAEWLVVIGVCTHLGCVPIANAGDFGGYYCPCHGSHYDASGRIRKGPAPLNLEVPAYVFPDDGTLIVG